MISFNFFKSLISLQSSKVNSYNNKGTEAEKLCVPSVLASFHRKLLTIKVFPSF